MMDAILEFVFYPDLYLLLVKIDWFQLEKVDSLCYF
jgi:hypothetical protein